MNKILSIIRAKKIFFIIGFILIVFLFGRVALLQKPSTILTYTVKQENLVDTIQVSGTYKTASQVQVMSPTNGIITKLYVNNGDQVNKGDSLFYVASTATPDQQNLAYTNYESALSSLQTAQQNKIGFQSQLEQDRQAVITASSNVDTMNNNRNTSTNNPATKLPYTQNDIDAIDSALTSSRQTFTKDEQKYLQADTPIAGAQAQVMNTKHLYAETQSVTVTAQTSGTISNLQDKIGDQVTAPPPPNTTTSNSSTPQPVLVIANLSGQYIAANISEDYAPHIQAGQKASIVFDALKDKSFTGSVASIDTLGTTDLQGIVTYTTRVVADDLTTNVKPGMTALINIETLRHDNVIDVPNSAIITKDGKTYIQKANTQNSNLIEVTTGIKGMTKTEVTSGLTSDTIIVANPSSTK